ncbi:MAG: histidinol-phosphate transaminase [Candidatus Omnitrophica bacterium]|nr:histidinol-phosphate transaminase [Candidatus Omnitrophota bacterium]MDD5429202.1 histidinol-phosphate transaminase [Candidatus Omnitrophota bacterium]
MKNKIYRQELDKIAVYKPGRPIEEVKRLLGLKDVHKLASNEIANFPDYARKAVIEELKNINRYPQGDCFYLREILAKKLKVDKERLVFGNGSDEVIALALRALINKGDEVIVAYPTFLIYEIQAKVHSARVVRAPLKGLRYNLEEILSKINKRTKIIFIANPDNPTGTYLNQKEIEGFLKKVPANVLVYLDEAYFEFAPADFPKSINLLKKRKNIIVSRTFSKVYGLAGLRIGYGITSKELAGVLNRIRDPFNVNRFAQAAAITALKSDNFVKKVLLDTAREKKYLYRELDKAGLSFIKSATNFILIKFAKDAGKLSEYLLRRGIIIRELGGWGLKGFFRVTLGTHKENAKFVEALKKFLSQSGKVSGRTKK